MASEAQIKANRANAKKSTGPRTSKGKARSARNAIKHGVLAQEVTAITEKTRQYEALLRKLVYEFDPQTEIESLLVQRLANLFWRERRLIQWEGSLISEEAERIDADEMRFPRFGREIRTVRLSFRDLDRIGRYQTAVGNQISQTLRQLRDLQEGRIAMFETASDADE